MQPHRFKTIAEYYQFREIPKPEHPLISVIDIGTIKALRGNETFSMVADFYLIGLKKNVNGKLRYGQQEYDFDSGAMFFMAPGQVFSVEVDGEWQHRGWVLLVHADFLWDTPLAKTIRQYDYFGYAAHEALHLSDKEEATVTAILKNIEQEYHANLDRFSQDIIITQITLLLNYAERFYQRQFLTRKKNNHTLLARLEATLADYFAGDTLAKNGLPTVQQIAEALNVSPGYLSGMLRVLTGQSTQQHIHDKLIEKAKEQLSTTDLSVSEIAYTLGFEHPQSFSKLFKTKTNLTPLAFRQSFN